MNKLSTMFIVLCVLTGCDQIFNKAEAEIMKMGLRDACGEDDSACIEAVNSQFDSCHRMFKDDWQRYMNASFSKEDEFLEIYSVGVYGCIVDENDEPYFYYDPE